MSKKDAKTPKAQGLGIAFGVLFGVVIGMFIDNVAMGIGIGVALGAAFEGGRYAYRKETEDADV